MTDDRLERIRGVLVHNNALYQSMLYFTFTYFTDTCKTK